MSSVKPATTLVSYSFSGNSLVYLIVLFRQKFPLVSVIVVVGLANLSCCCDLYVANKPDKKSVRQRTPPSEIILFWSHVTSVFQGLSLSLAPNGGYDRTLGTRLVCPMKQQLKLIVYQLVYQPTYHLDFKRFSCLLTSRK